LFEIRRYRRACNANRSIVQVSDPDVHVPMKVVRYRHRDRDREKSVGDGERVEVSIAPKELGEQKPSGEGRRARTGFGRCAAENSRAATPTAFLGPRRASSRR